MHLRTFFQIFFQKQGQKGAGDRFNRADAQGACRGGIFGNGFDGFRFQLYHIIRIGKKGAPLFGKQHTLADAVEQIDTQFLLQLLNLQGDGGLCIAQNLRRLGKVFKFRYFDK